MQQSKTSRKSKQCSVRKLYSAELVWVLHLVKMFDINCISAPKTAVVRKIQKLKLIGRWFRLLALLYERTPTNLIEFCFKAGK